MKTRPRKSSPQVGYKYVDVRHAEAMAAGSLRIGTLASFASIEAARKDEAEGILVSRPFTGVFDNPTVPISVFGGQFTFAAGTIITMTNCTFERAVPPAYAFCFSLDLSASEPRMIDKALFKISDIDALRQAISSSHDQLKGQWWSQPVKYGSRTIDPNPFSFPITGDPFLKEAVHSWECEHRFVWRPVKEAKTDDDLEPIFTGVNDQIAKLLERIR